LPNFSSVDDALLVEGRQFDRVVEAGPVFKGVQLPYNVESLPGIVREWIHCFYTLQSARNVFMHWQQIANVHSRSLYVTGESMREAFLQTISAAEINDSNRVKVELGLWEKSIRFPFGLLYSAFFFMWHFLTNKSFLLFEIQGRYALQRKVFLTKHGYLGLASCTTRVGDSVVICKGSSVPLITKRNGEEDDSFRLIKDAYIHKIIRGEAFQDNMCQRIFIK
jgi:hypothetical protein